MRTLLLLIALVSPAFADGAADHIAAGKRAFADQRYAEAAAEFRAAYDLQPDPKLLYSIAQAQRMAGDCTGAIASYEAFIATKSDPKLSEFSKENIARCKELLAKEPPPPPPPVEQPAEPPPPAPPVEKPRETAMPPPVERPPAPAGAAPWYRDYVGDALLGGGAAAIVVGGVVWLGGRSAARAANDASDYATFVAKRDAAASAVTKQAVGIGVGIAGVALAIGGVVHFTIAGRRGEVHATGTGVAARVRF
jgi:tetratricopeptide (TPR) repeat protein